MIRKFSLENQMNKGYLEEWVFWRGKFVSIRLSFFLAPLFRKPGQAKIFREHGILKVCQRKSTYISTTLMNVQKMFGYRTCNRTIPTRRIWPRKTMREEKVEVLP